MSFTYTPLPNDVQWFRLLRIDRRWLPGRRRMSCTVQHFQLKTAPDYFVLSYTEGRPVPINPPTTIDGRTPYPMANKLCAPNIDWERADYDMDINGSRFCVRRNLWDALESLEKSHLRKWLWIEPICIDQSNMCEREAQVGRISVMCACAVSVIVWLGKLDETALQSLALYQKLGAKAVSGIGSIRPAGPMNVTFGAVDAWSSSAYSRVPAQWWWSLCQFYRRSCFQQLWTLIRAITARRLTFVCGYIKFTMRTCAAVADYAYAYRWDERLSKSCKISKQVLRATFMVWSLFTCLEETCRFYRCSTDPNVVIVTEIVDNTWSPAALLLLLMWKINQCEVSDPRDKYYGPLSTLQVVFHGDPKLAQSEVLTIDYETNTTQLSSKLACWFIDRLSSLAYLSTVPYRPSEELVIGKPPSWAWDLDIKGPRLEPFGMMASLTTRRPLYNASRSANLMDILPKYWRRDQHGRLFLFVKGLKHGKVESVIYHDSHGIMPFVDAKVAFRIVSFLAAILQKHSKEAHSGQTLPDALWRTIIGDTMDGLPASPDSDQLFRAWLAVTLHASLKKTFTDPMLRSVHLESANCIRELAYIHEECPVDATFCLPTVYEVLELDHAIRQKKASFNGRQVSEYKEAYRMFSRELNRLVSRKLVTTSGGGLALVPSDAKPGDLIAVLANANVPFVLRPFAGVSVEGLDYDGNEIADSTSVGPFQLVGDAYVHGIMYGESIDFFWEDHREVPWETLALV